MENDCVETAWREISEKERNKFRKNQDIRRTTIVRGSWWKNIVI